MYPTTQPWKLQADLPFMVEKKIKKQKKRKKLQNSFEKLFLVFNINRLICIKNNSYVYKLTFEY